MKCCAAPAIVRRLVRQWFTETGLRPEAINSGSCYSFAQCLIHALPDSRLIWSDKYDHAYVRYRGRLYDAEAPRGVRDYRSLPCIKRQKI